MSKGLLVTTAVGLLFVAAAAWAQDQSSAGQNSSWSADGTAAWNGPGYYAEAVNGLGALAGGVASDYGGPYANTSDCNAAIAANVKPEDRSAFSCVYYGTQQDFGSS
ncbi:MAG: hypothetical protein KGL29_09145 [Alphaproteobacteria bacterium]|nr:hypothetical protein [Alphaproteobacteria bacterium]MDE2499923.1 hypothetical protein [Alphaproteobacteria bacterium]